MGMELLVLLVRHAHTAASESRLSGRMPGVRLSDRGHEELLRLRAQLAGVTLDAIYSSPLLRARDTAAPLASDHCLSVDVERDLTEVDFGQWTGMTFDALRSDSRWHAFNARRASAVVPGGERPVDVQRRVVTVLTRLAGRHRTGTIALVSHAEVIRSALLWFSGRSLDDFQQCAIDTASISGLLMSARPEVLFVNATEGSPLQLSNQRHTF
jgi:broad specificity phosphatase PhoE